jgi:small subunit ribosomal protein S6
LSEDQAKDAVDKFVKVLKKANADVINIEQWGVIFNFFFYQFPRK